MPACGRHQHCHSKSMAVYPIVSRAAGGSPLSFTVAGIADAPPGEIFSFLINPQEQVGVVSSIQGVEEHARKEVDGLAGRLLAEVEYTMRAVASLFGQSFPSTMRIRLTADHEAKQANFQLMEGNSLIAHMQGSNIVLPLLGGHGVDLEAEVHRAVDAFLAALSSGAGSNRAHPALPAQQADASKVAEMAPRGGSTVQHSIVIMHQQLKPRFCPPPFGRLLRGNMLGQNERTLKEVLVHFNANSGKAPACRELAAEE